MQCTLAHVQVLARVLYLLAIPFYKVIFKTEANLATLCPKIICIRKQEVEMVKYSLKIKQESLCLQ